MPAGGAAVAAAPATGAARRCWGRSQEGSQGRTDDDMGFGLFRLNSLIHP